MEYLTHKAEWLLNEVKKLGAEQADLLISHSTSANANIRKGELEELERAESGGLGLRVFINQQCGIVSASDLRSDSLSQVAQRAVAIAKKAPQDAYSGLADATKLAQNWPELELADKGEPETDWLTEQATACEAAALSEKGITNSEGGSAGYGRSKLSLLTSDGFEGHYEKSSFSVSVSALAGEGTGMERDYAYSSARHLQDLRDAGSVGKEAAKRTLERLNPRKVDTAEVPVIFDKRISKGLLGSFANAISGASVARGTSFLKDKLGEAIFHPSITIVDDPHRIRGMGSRPFDAEGCRSEALTLVENGVLQHWLLDSRSGRQLEMAPNGRASRGLSSNGSPSSTNLWMEAGELSAESLIGEIDNGFYVTDTFGMGVNLLTGDYSQGASGFWIENGKLSYPVSEVTIAGHLGEMFKELTPANDLSFEYATNCPTLRIASMTVVGN
jgi:PmbA protein